MKMKINFNTYIIRIRKSINQPNLYINNLTNEEIALLKLENDSIKNEIENALIEDEIENILINNEQETDPVIELILIK